MRKDETFDRNNIILYIFFIFLILNIGLNQSIESMT